MITDLNYANVGFYFVGGGAGLCLFCLVLRASGHGLRARCIAIPVVWRSVWSLVWHFVHASGATAAAVLSFLLGRGK